MILCLQRLRYLQGILKSLYLIMPLFVQDMTALVQRIISAASHTDASQGFTNLEEIVGLR
jgi:hypothetical protein